VFNLNTKAPMIVIGHRGFPASYPENTIPSFQAAVKAGADGVELDVHMSKDGELIVMHDYTVDRTTDGHGRISSMTLEEIRRLDAGVKRGVKGIGVPTLEEVFEAVGDVLYVVEIKRGSYLYPGIEEKVISRIRAHRVRAQVVSFDYDALKVVRSLDPSLETGVIFVGRAPYMVSVGKEVRATWLRGASDLLQEGDGDAVHAQGFKLDAWAPSTPQDLASAMRIGADSLTTNSPELALKVLRELKGK